MNNNIYLSKKNFSFETSIIFKMQFHFFHNKSSL